eukprot:2085853-Amphidinium_carterae.1
MHSVEPTWPGKGFVIRYSCKRFIGGNRQERLSGALYDYEWQKSGKQYKEWGRAAVEAEAKVAQRLRSFAAACRAAEGFEQPTILKALAHGCDVNIREKKATVFAQVTCIAHGRTRQHTSLRATAVTDEANGCSWVEQLVQHSKHPRTPPLKLVMPAGCS